LDSAVDSGETEIAYSKGYKGSNCNLRYLWHASVMIKLLAVISIYTTYKRIPQHHSITKPTVSLPIKYPDALK